LKTENMPRPLTILVAEDNPSDAELAVRQLKRDGFEPIWERVDTERGFRDRLRPELDLIISDYEMPQFSGIRALELLRETGLDIPFILVSGTIGEEVAVLAMKAGASDYFLKDRLVRLGQAVDHALDESRLRRERKHATEALLLFRALVDQSNDSFEVIDPVTGQFIDVNEKGFLSLGYSRREFMALSVFDVDPTVQPSTWPKLVERIIAEGSVSGEGCHQRKDGTTFPVEFNVKYVKLDREYLVAVVRDISERKELESKFFRAQRLESIGSMASGIAHDMNNILAPILMSAPMLRMGMSAENTERTLNAIEQSAQRGADLVRQLLTFGRGSEGARRPLQIASLVHEMFNIAQQTFPKNISVVENYSMDNWRVSGDPTQLHQVLLNLCVNARDAMPAGGTLTISADNVEFDRSSAGMTPGAKAGPYVLLQVADTGTGIPPHVVDRIFDPFFTTKEPGKGTGLGLSTVVGIAKSHGGFVSLQTTEGKGSVFQVYLPAVMERDVAAAPAAPAAAPTGSGELILLVDDEESIRNVSRDILVSHEYQVITAKDGADAASQFALRRGEIRAVITDLEMPIMGGAMLIRVLRNLNPEVDVIVSSGVEGIQGIEAQRAELEALGVKIMLKKPYTAETILVAVHKLMSGKPVP
jgi:two-component system cell cycle sensor histidine kinase/response regulator CckA